MPPRFAYWTILAGGLPTAFRATERDELLPTFNRIREKHPDAEMKWFARGKLWNSPEEARVHTPRAPHDGGERRRSFRPRGESEGSRDRDWRPGGDHRDPRQDLKDKKRVHNRKLRAQRWARKHEGDRGQGMRDSGQGTGDRARQGNRDQNWKSQGNRPWKSDRPKAHGHKSW